MTMYDSPFHYGYDAPFHYAWGFTGYSSQGMDPLQMPFLELFPVELLDIVTDLCYLIFCKFFLFISDFFLSLENMQKQTGTDFQTQRSMHWSLNMAINLYKIIANQCTDKTKALNRYQVSRVLP